MSSIWSMSVIGPYARQFVPDGDGYAFRKYQRDAPVRVSTEERDAFVADYDRQMRWLYPAMIVGIAVMGMATVTIATALPDGYIVPLTLSGIALVLLPSMWLMFRVWNAVTRAVAERPAIGERRSRDEWGRIKLESLSYGWMGVLALMGASQFVVAIVDRRGLLPGWDGIRVALPLALLAVVAVQAFRKWRMERAG